MKRFFAWVKALFNRGMDKLEDPEMMLDQARREMQANLTGNREKAVQAIAQRNRLQQIYDEQNQKSAMLEKQAATALQQGNRDLARTFIREKQTVDGGLESLKSSLDQASETVENVKVAIRRQEEEVRKKYSEALALKAQWKQAQIQSSITKALEGLTFDNEYEGSYAAAKDRIKDKMAEATARQEMFGGSIAGKTMQMQDMAMDGQADEELAKLELKLGLATAPKVTENAPAVEVSAEGVDNALDALEKRINDGGSA